ncbi:hemicentin-1-like [Ptychodera flava]|uniref:hemicentin-1-like n=1 Tax=Ptychodera flava TaxID=63121 RepID=UPI00396A4EAF
MTRTTELLFLAGFVVGCALYGGRAFEVVPTDTLVLSGDVTQLNCTFEGQPIIPAWYRNNSLLSLNDDVRFENDTYEIVGIGPEYNLRILNVTRDEEASYTCKDLAILDSEASADLFTVGSAPSASASPGNTVIESENVTFTCEIDLDPLAPGDLVWLKDGRESSRGRTPVSQWTTQFNRTDNGADIRCRLEYITLPSSKWPLITSAENITMDVQYAATVRIDSDDNTNYAIEGRPYEATCVIVDGNPAVASEVYWTSRGGERISENRTVLTLANVTVMDEGNYSCFVSNTFYNEQTGTGQASVFIDVQYHPVVFVDDINNGTFTVIEGQPYTAICMVDADPEADNVTWTTSNDAIVATGEELAIPAATRDQADVYTCRAQNTFYNNETGEGFQGVYLDVQYKPNVTVVVSGDASDGGRAIEGSSFSLQCHVDANPDIDTLTWSRGSNYSTHSNWLNFTEIQRSGSANYTCAARNTFWNDQEGRGSATFNVQVEYSPDVTVVGDFVRVEGSVFTADCEVDSFPRAAVVWVDGDGSTVQEGESLTIENVGRRRAGSYTCFATTLFWDGTTANESITRYLDVHYAPSLSTEQLVRVKEFENVTVDCLVADANPNNVSFTWYDQDGAILSEDSALVLDDVTRDASGRYVCNGTNLLIGGVVGEGSNRTELDVQYPPTVSVNGSVVTVEGRSFTSLCEVDSNPDPTITWFGDSDHYVQSGNELILDNVDRRQSGNYTCHAQTVFWDGTTGNGSEILFLDVQYPPSVMTEPLIQTKELDDVNFYCNVTDGNPSDATLAWFSPNGSRIATIDTVVLENVTRDSEGLYSCIVGNLFFDDTEGEDVGSTYLDVQYIPDVRVADKTCKEGEDVSLECVVDANPPPSAFNWTKDGEILSNEQNFTIQSCDKSHQGTYTCAVVNVFYDGSEGRGQASLELTVQLHTPDDSDASEPVTVIGVIVVASIGTATGLFILTGVLFFACRALFCKTSTKTLTSGDQVEMVDVDGMTDIAITASEVEKRPENTAMGLQFQRAPQQTYDAHMVLYPTPRPRSELYQYNSKERTTIFKKRESTKSRTNGKEENSDENETIYTLYDELLKSDPYLMKGITDKNNENGSNDSKSVSTDDSDTGLNNRVTFQSNGRAKIQNENKTSMM